MCFLNYKVRLLVSELYIYQNARCNNKINKIKNKTLHFIHFFVNSLDEYYEITISLNIYTLTSKFHDTEADRISGDTP